jgi:Family of unknown function (DUF6308)
MPDVSALSLCGGTLVVSDPVGLVEEYLDPAAGYSRAYDTLVTNGSAELVSGDLLAPALLDSPVDAARFAVLSELLPALSAVADLPAVALQDADDEVIDAVAALFRVLDAPHYRRRNVRGTVVAKVLHRKRPDLVPLYDSRIYTAYTTDDVVPRQPGSWEAFMAALARQMRADLTANAAEFTDLHACAQSHGSELTWLRLLDIVVWMSAGEV